MEVGGRGWWGGAWRVWARCGGWWERVAVAAVIRITFVTHISTARCGGWRPVARAAVVLPLSRRGRWWRGVKGVAQQWCWAGGSSYMATIITWAAGSVKSCHAYHRNRLGHWFRHQSQRLGRQRISCRVLTWHFIPWPKSAKQRIIIAWFIS